jgi:RNA polymerase sigma-70 factor (family 1)
MYFEMFFNPFFPVILLLIKNLDERFKVEYMKQDFTAILESYNVRIYAYVLAISKSAHVAEDITQDIMVKIWLKKDELGEITNLDGYIFVMAKNMTLNHLLKVSYNQKMAAELVKAVKTSSSQTDSRVLLFDYNRLINEAADQLSPQRKLVFKLSREQELSYDEIALRLNVSKFTVKNHYLTALSVIRAFLIKNGINPVIIFFILWINAL